jgi:NADH-quinone oxidoreductase subunit D
MVELNRIASHLIFWGVTAMDVGAYTPFLYGLREREDIMDLFEITCGQRLTYNYIRIGGVSKDIPPEFVPKCREFVKMMWSKFSDYEGLLNENPIFLARMKGIGILTPETAIAYGASGPVLRASGVKYDVRRNDPYSVYDKFDFEIPTQPNGDCYDRFIHLPEGDIKCKVKPKFKPPEGEVYSRIESARGEMGVYIRSDGTTKPMRLKLRGSSYNHLMLVPEISTDVLIADVVAIFATLDIIMPEVDR